jgi:hypothetical protein
MSKGPACFYCKNSKNGRPAEIGWSYDCSFGLDNSKLVGDVDDVLKCKKGDPRVGFQIGGYYTHMWFEKDGDCLSWIIASDGEFPTDDPKKFIVFHICDFEQLKDFVEFWGKELHRKEDE